MAFRTRLIPSPAEDEVSVMEIQPADSSFLKAHSSRRRFLGVTAAGVLTAGTTMAAAASQPRNTLNGTEGDDDGFRIDTHMHVWSGDTQRFPFNHPTAPNFTPPKTAATAELLLEEMDQFSISHCVLVQTIYHGWDNSYLAKCLKEHPDRFKGQGLIDPTDQHAAAQLEFWMREHGLSGMRFSPIYYENRDAWMTSDAAVELWQKAESLGAIFNFFISTPQLPTLETMISRFPNVPVVIDHLARIDLKASDPLPEFQKLLALARYPAVYVKVSELSVLSPSQKYPWRDTFEWVRRMYDAFGPDRMMWGTGFPGATRAEAGRPSLTQELDLINREIEFLTTEDRAKILGRNAAKLWNFLPRTA